MPIKEVGRPLMLGLGGFGTVGGGLGRLLEENREEIRMRTGRDIRIKSVLVRDPAKKRAVPYPEGAEVCTDMSALLNDPEIDVIVEMMGGIAAPKKLILAALEAGKHVVTANKALLAEDGEEIFRLAAQKGLHVGYEASVCGAIPIVKTMKDSLAGNRILTVSGILNGTSNYILSAMTSDGASFKEALKKAQELGFAEADPTLDIEGFDAAHKLTLLIRLAWGVDYPFKKLPVTGISQVAPEDIQFAREFGYNIKLLGQARMENGKIEAGVFPTLVPKSYLLAKVGHSYNAARVEGNAAGSIFLHGLGAGDLPTGSAVASDIMEIARGARPNNLGYVLESLPEAAIMPPNEAEASYYFRLMVMDRPGALRDIAGALADHGISIAQALQKGQKDVVPLMFMTHNTTVNKVQAALAQIKGTGMLTAEPVTYRIMPPPAAQA